MLSRGYKNATKYSCEGKKDQMNLILSYSMFLTENGNLVMAVFDLFSVKMIYNVYNPWSFKL